MKKLLFLLVMMPTLIFAQKIKVISGNYDFLKDQNELNVEFNYDGMTFYNEKISEEEYIKRRVEDIGKNKGNAEADIWKKDWEHSKTNAFPGKFFTSMNKNTSLKSGSYPNAKYTLIMTTTWIYPGWFAAVMKQHGKVSSNLKFVETANRSNVLLEINSDKAPADLNWVGIPNNNDRIAEGYAKTGKTLAKLIASKANKKL